MKVGLFFGTFNPIHVGHLIIANYMAEFTDLEQVWLVVSPQNPLKQKDNLLQDHHRLQLVRIAIEDNPKLRANNIEFDLPRPSYTIDTLTYLSEKSPDHEFVPIMGSDNLKTLHKWKNYEQLLKYYQIYVYQRPGYNSDDYENHELVRSFDVPLMYISATFIRNAIRDGKSVRYFIPEKVLKYIEEMHFYKK